MLTATRVETVARQEANGSIEPGWFAPLDPRTGRPVLCTPFIALLARAASRVVVRQCGLNLGLVTQEPEIAEDNVRNLGTSTTEQLMELRQEALAAS